MSAIFIAVEALGMAEPYYFTAEDFLGAFRKNHIKSELSGRPLSPAIYGGRLNLPLNEALGMTKEGLGKIIGTEDVQAPVVPKTATSWFESGANDFRTLNKELLGWLFDQKKRRRTQNLQHQLNELRLSIQSFPTPAHLGLVNFSLIEGFREGNVTSPITTRPYVFRTQGSVFTSLNRSPAWLSTWNSSDLRYFVQRAISRYPYLEIKPNYWTPTWTELNFRYSGNLALRSTLKTGFLNIWAHQQLHVARGISWVLQHR